MITRVLPPEEWPRLVGTSLDPLWRDCNPSFTEIIVVEQDGQIVGSIALLATLHAECAQIRGGIGVRRALWRALQDRVKHAGGSAVWGAAIDDDMRSLLERHGTAIPGDHFLVRM